MMSFGEHLPPRPSSPLLVPPRPSSSLLAPPRPPSSPPLLAPPQTLPHTHIHTHPSLVFCLHSFLPPGLSLCFPSPQSPSRQRSHRRGSYCGMGGWGKSSVAERRGGSIHTSVRHTTSFLTVVNNNNNNNNSIVISQVPLSATLSCTLPPSLPIPLLFNPYYLPLSVTPFSPHGLTFNTSPGASPSPFDMSTPLIHPSHLPFHTFVITDVPPLIGFNTSPGTSPSPFDMSSSLLFSFHGHAASHVKKHRWVERVIIAHHSLLVSLSYLIAQ